MVFIFSTYCFWKEVRSVKCAIFENRGVLKIVFVPVNVKFFILKNLRTC